MSKLWPRTLLWQTFLLIAILMLLSVSAWYSIYRTYDREPHARQLAQLVESAINLTRGAIINARPDKRQALLLELSNREGIHIYPVEKDEIIAPLPDRPTLKMAAEQLRNKLGPHTRMTMERNGERALFVSFHLEDQKEEVKIGEKDEAEEENEYWIALPRERIEHVVPWQWMAWGIAALLLSLAGAYLIMFRVTRPLKSLSAAAVEIGRGRTPPPVEEAGPSEISALARAFNQMSADLAHLDSDRALILAGISHDLRTPLTRLRMIVELSNADEATRDGMSIDIDEMDQTIGQFLDFARATSGEALQETDLAGLLEEVVNQYQRHGYSVEIDLAALPRVQLRTKGLRRAIGNLIDNALRHAGKDLPVLIVLRQVGRIIHIEVGDRGRGIPTEEVERLKLPFTRLDAARSNVSGAGLGLAIVDRVARDHGGKLELLPRDGGGTLARVSFPAIAAAANG